ncbi:hypothetical protein A3A68_01700 [Candidatus Saccharibacteria bacterium RIFCSPLOWO2_01_FULL_48_13]|nr:MAG: hypothetical protein A2884_01850 [Candidatus Saccharibacteria bacterium RIFCSPHIGHO2_01_FULL_48_12]OGL35922.1 MAG: hypothetical protein A3F38_00270 [Candidatus Saccharibacteria bacterium RIFCSPHIGHO2_12_FULL_48_21]OGL37461.1 MAG: hypothetical protein A3A68_01700 [Candidatus Saccharibacteria bacterium RIFCSPLOWO2_01_FULL_48_13]
MDNAAETLLIVVSSTLTVFLIVGIVALVYFVKLLGQLRRIAERADNVAESVENVAESFEKKAGGLAILSMITKIVESVTKAKKGKK